MRSPLHADNISTPMTCRDLLFNILYRADISLMRDMVMDSLDRLGDVAWPRDTLSAMRDLTVLRCAFFMLLNRDMNLKNLALTGVCITIPKMDRRKAEAFFLALDGEVLKPFFCNQRMTPAELVDSLKHLYLAA